MIVLPLALAVGTGCRKNEVSAAPGANLPAPNGAPPATAAAAQQPEGAPVKGTVQEKIDAASYSYLRLKTASGEVWAAVPQAEVATGAEVSIVGAMVMQDFESKTLKRKFDRILFGTLGGAAGAGGDTKTAAAEGGANPHGGMGAMGGGMGAMGGGMGAMGGNPHGGEKAPAADTGPIKVDKAPGAEGKTVAELYAGKAKLKDTKVAVRGKVVKVTEGVMGHNWLHLRDGSGTAEKGDNDITVTTDGKAAVGDVVLVQGVLHADKDFGAGYSYPLIIEEASVSK